MGSPPSHDLARRTLEFPGPSSGRPLRLVSIGTRGPTLVYFASSGGDETEFERYRMHRPAAARIRQGRLRVIAVDGRGPQTFWDDERSPAERLESYAALHADLLDVLLPVLHELSGERRLTLAGASYGAHVAANLWLDRPHEVATVCGLGGVFGLRHRMPGVSDPLATRLTPLERLPLITDPDRLRALRTTEGLTIYAAADDGWLDSSLEMSRRLAARSLPHSLAVWPSPADHHERWWSDQLTRFLRRRFGEPPPPG